MCHLPSHLAMSSLIEEELPSDAIGSTVYSRKWVVGCLLKTIKFVQNEPFNTLHNEDGDDEPDISDIETELCTLWDMSSNEHVQEVMLENNAHEIFMNVSLKTDSLRLAEISIGILGNLIHHDEISKLVSADIEFPTNVISLLSSTDIPLLTQLIRFLNTIVCKEANIWYTAISRNSDSFFRSVKFLLQNCLNVDLLKLTFSLLNNILYAHSSLGELWLDNDRDHELVFILCQACFTMMSSIDLSNDTEISEGWTGISPSSVDFFYQFWFIIQSFYETDFYNDKFKSNLHSLDDLFSRFDNLLSETPNSLLSYTAACSFYMALFDSEQNISSHNDPKWDPVRQLKEKMRQDKSLKTTHRRTIQLCGSTVDQMREQLEEALSILQQFDRDILRRPLSCGKSPR